MYGKPLEEIDQFIYEETFCVVSKRFQKNYIHRFTGTKSLFLFPPWNTLRRICVFIATNQFFDYLVMATILCNCVFLAMSETIEEAEFFFLAIYTIEMCIKIVAKGFVLNKYTYLRNPWNWLDFLVIASGYATIGLDVGNLAGLRTFRVLRALKTVSIMPGLKTIINALLHSFKQLAEVMTLTIFCLMVFALFALQVYMGELRNKCVLNHPSWWTNVTYEDWYEWISNSSNWVYRDDMPMLCGNLTGAQHCMADYTCLRVGENPNHGYTSFDNFMWSMLTTFQLITLDYWENTYNMIIATCGPMSVTFFTIVVFFGSFYLINLMLAVVALSYEEEAEITQEERRKDLIDHRDDSTFSFDPTHLNLKQLNKQASKKFDTRRNILMASYSRKKTRRRKKGKEGKAPNNKSISSGNNNNNSNSENVDDNKSIDTNKSATPSPNPSPRHSNTTVTETVVRPPQTLALQKTRGLLQQAQLNQLQQQHQATDDNENSNTLHPLRGQLLSSRQASSNRDSSLDDSGVVDDHEDNQEPEPEPDNQQHQSSNMEVTLALSPKEVKIIKCNDDLPDDRNCECCVHCCFKYETWLSFQNSLYEVVKDPLFELFITLCIVLNTTFLALEHHGMSETVRSVLDIGNKVFTLVFTLECFMKVIALSKEFFLCGWNIFDLCIVTASIMDLIFELVDGLSVLRGLRLLRVLKLAQSWVTMRVLLSIILSTIGALGNLTFILVIVIYIFAVIGMQLFGKDYTREKFYPDPVPRWNFNDFFHSFMMIFRILCGEWIEPLWDCMRAEEASGSKSSCFAIFLPALVMGNFMVLNLFLALLLNSFNSEELKSRKEEVGDEGRLAKSFERIRSIVRKGRFRKQDSNDPGETKLEKLVHEIILKQHHKQIPEVKGILADPMRMQIKEYCCVSPPYQLQQHQQPLPIYSKSYQESLNRPVSVCDIQEVNLNIVNTISGSQETVTEMDDQQLPDDKMRVRTNNKNGILHQMSSGFGTQQSKDEPFEQQYDAVELRGGVALGPTTIIKTKGIPQHIIQQKRQSCPMPRQPQNNYSQAQNAIDTNSNSSSCTFSEQISKQLKRLSSNQSINTLSLDQDEFLNHLNHVNLKDELLNCDKKELFQFLRDEKLFDSFYNEPVSSSVPEPNNKNDTNNSNNNNNRKSVHIQDEIELVKSPVRQFHDCEKLPSVTKMSEIDQATGKPWHCLVSYVDDITVGGRRNSQGEYNDPTNYPGFGRNKTNKVPNDCFPRQCYDKCPCWDEWIKSKIGQKWQNIRTQVLQVVDTPTFEWVILFLIFASSITLCFEDIHLDKNKELKRVLYWTNLFFCCIFVAEMLLKWLANGFTKYFSSFWTILDFIIVFVSVFSLLIEENENLKVLRSLRTLRALRPLRAISRWQGMRIVVNALMYAIPSIFNVLLVCLVFWLIFSIMGVQFFGGKFFKCKDEDGEVLPISVVNDKWQCLSLNYTWINSKITFDHVGMGYLALFQIATFEGWMEVMADAVDSRGVDLQPSREASLYAYIYFVIFIICGSFFTLNLFIGVIIDNFNMLKKKYEGGILEMFLTPSQKSYYCAMKKLGRKKPQKVIKRPLNHIMAMFYDLANSRRFEIAIFVLIFLNMLSMGIEHYNQPHAIFFILEVSNAFFTTVFGLECIVKIVGLRHHYFTVPWNLFDFLLVLASIFGILMEDIMIDLPISPTLLRVVRVFRIGRILRLIKAAKGIRKLLFALVVSLPALFNIGALLALLLFVYAILGMSLFGHVKKQGALSEMVNFETFSSSMQLLFRLMTSAGWNDVLESLMIQPPDCDLHKDGTSNGDCGHPLLAITYFTSFIIISYMIVINMYIAIILENFNQAHQEEEVGIVEDDLEMFYIRWSKYDPHASQFISFSQLSDFIASLDPPLGIPKPNTLALVSFNLPISKGNKIHCLDILHALVKHVLGHVDESDTFKQLQDQMDVKFKKQFPTRKELEIVSSTRIWKRQERAAKTIQLGWKEYLRLKRERDRSPMSGDEDQTQTSSPGWQSKLSALNFLHLQIHRRCSRTSSRCSSRKSSRASGDSDMSELAGPWLNLPILVAGTSDLVKNNPNDPDGKKDFAAPPEGRQQRRKSIYNFFLGRQDAVDDHLTSPSVHKKVNKPNEAALPDSKESLTSPPTKSKRATSFIKKKPRLERGLSDHSVLRLNRNANLDPDSAMNSDVSILVTDASPEVPNCPNINSNQTLIHHVIVHRESEEYHELEEVVTDQPRPSKDSTTPDNTQLQLHHPIVTICVDSPKDEEQRSIAQTPDIEKIILERSTLAAESSNVVNESGTCHNVDEPIDINLASTCDTSKVIYDY
ncbi:sodium channel protein 60E-like isoform X2 [Chironomus tepperi]|uniref:sodium channel protein 60E-like isoform X2 n=1 Tax=Chironomus tepperi TaxID=113505 RepID=UPI00391F2090